MFLKGMTYLNAAADDGEKGIDEQDVPLIQRATDELAEATRDFNEATAKLQALQTD